MKFLVWSPLKPLGVNIKSTGVTLAGLTVIFPTFLTVNRLIVGLTDNVGSPGIVKSGFSGNSTVGGSAGVFTCGFILGADIVVGVFTTTFKSTLLFVTSFGKIWASNSTSLVGS